MGKAKDYTGWIGKRSGKLVVKDIKSLPDPYHRKRPNGNSVKSLSFVCACDCGETYIASPYRFTNSLSKSCGCANKPKFPASQKHGMSKTRFYHIWHGILTRCFNEKEIYYKNYGGRGITVSEEWKDFINFKRDMYKSYLEHAEKHGEKNTTIEREDVNGNYEISNCRWATNLEQQYNRRTTKRLNWKGEKLTLHQIAEKEGINYRTLRGRYLYYGYSLEMAVNGEKFKKRSQGTELHNHEGELLTLTEIAYKVGMCHETLRERVRLKGIPLEEALAMPVKKTKKRDHKYHFRGREYTLTELSEVVGIPRKPLQKRLWRHGDDVEKAIKNKTKKRKEEINNG